MGTLEQPGAPPGGVSRYATFQPTFLYELIWNRLLAGLLIWLGRRRAVKAPGLFALYVAGYSLARMGEELLRVDYSERILGLRLNFYVPTLLFLAGTRGSSRSNAGTANDRAKHRRCGAGKRC